MKRLPKQVLTLSSGRVVLALAVTILTGACSPTDSVPNVPRRTVPYPLVRSGVDVANDSLVVDAWTTRTEIPDPLADQDGGPKIRIEATLYGEDVIAATTAGTCKAESTDVDTCRQRERQRYDAAHRPDSLFRIRLSLQSTFSVNSLDRKFWDIYVQDEQDISHEPMKVEMRDPVVVREDTLPEPGRAAVRAGLYRRVIDLYFPLRTPFGHETISPQVNEVRLIISREQKQLAELVWNIQREGKHVSVDRRKRRGAPLDF